MANKKLYFVVPGLRGTRRKWEPLLKRLQEEPELVDSENARWEFWHHKKRLLSLGGARRAANELRATITALEAANGRYDEIVLVGHSFGAILLRDAYLLEARAGELDENGDPIQPDHDNWAARVERIILFASVCRGFNPEVKLSNRLSVAVARLLLIYNYFLVSDLQQGSAYITNLRLTWIRHFHHLGSTFRDPTVVQLLGTADALVKRADSLDVEQFPNSAVVDIPGASHDSLYRIDRAGNPELVYALIRSVFIREYRSPTADQPQQFRQQNIVFILHGIRASNLGWVDDTAHIIRNKYCGTIIRTPTYGYLSALHFFLPWMRRTKARWFQDQYSDLAARHPDARFFFIGHSNATYMFGHSLAQVESMRFVSGYMAGSVLPSSYDWTRCFNRRQVKFLRSDASSADWPVGFLCSALSFMGDIGTGGFFGFRAAPNELREYRYYRGGHSKPLEDRRNLERIVDEMMTGTIQEPIEELCQPKPWFAFISRVLKYVGPVLLIGLLVAAGLATYLHPDLIEHWWIPLAGGLFVLGVLLLSF